MKRLLAISVLLVVLSFILCFVDTFFDSGYEKYNLLAAMVLVLIGGAGMLYVMWKVSP